MVGDDHGHVELLSQLHEFAEELAQVLLSFAELASSREVDAVERHDRVDDEERVVVLHHHGGRSHEQRGLVLGGVRARVGDVGQHGVLVEAVALGDRGDALGPAA